MLQVPPNNRCCPAGTVSRRELKEMWNIKSAGTKLNGPENWSLLQGRVVWDWVVLSRSGGGGSACIKHFLLQQQQQHHAKSCKFPPPWLSDVETNGAQCVHTECAHVQAQPTPPPPCFPLSPQCLQLPFGIG